MRAGKSLSNYKLRFTQRVSNKSHKIDVEEGRVRTFSKAHIKMASLGKEYSWAVVQLVMNIKNPVNMPFFARKADIPFVIQISSAYANNVQIPPRESICSATLLQADSSAQMD